MPKNGAEQLLVAWAVTAVALVLAAVLWVANATRLVPYETVWGDFGTWAQALLTGGGLVFAGVSVRVALAQAKRSVDVETNRLQEIKDVARRGAVLRSRWIETRYLPENAGRLTYQYELLNTSRFVISNCKILVHMWDDDNSQYYDVNNLSREDDIYQAVAIGVLAPGEAARGRFVVTNETAANPMYQADRKANPDFTFTDAWGVHWRRPGTTRLHAESPDKAEDRPQCMCCGYLPDEIAPILA